MRSLLALLSLCAALSFGPAQAQQNCPATPAGGTSNTTCANTAFVQKALAAFGAVSGPASSTAGDAAIFADPSGKVLQDAGFPPVEGPASSTANHLATFADTSGHVLKDGGIQESISVAQAGIGNFNLSASATNFFWNGVPFATQSVIAVPWAIGGTFSKMNISLTGPPGSGKSYAFTIVINGSAGNETCTISGASATTCSDSTHSDAITAGQTVSIQAVPSGTPTAQGVYATLQFQTP